MQKSKRTFSATTVLLLLGVMLVLATTETESYLQKQAAASKPPKVVVAHPYYPRATYDRFKSYTSETYLWHYDYNKSEQENQKDFDNWLCSNNTTGHIPQVCVDTVLSNKKIKYQESQELVYVMRYFVVYGNSYAWYLADLNKEGRPIQVDDIKQLIVAQMHQNISTAPIPTAHTWSVFLKYEQKAFHYDYKKTEQQDLRNYEKWNNEKYYDNASVTTGERALRWMWFSEKARDTMLYRLADSYVTGSPSGMVNFPVSPDKVTATDVRIWFSYEGKRLDYLWRV